MKSEKMCVVVSGATTTSRSSPPLPLSSKRRKLFSFGKMRKKIVPLNVNLRLSNTVLNVEKTDGKRQTENDIIMKDTTRRTCWRRTEEESSFGKRTL